MPIRHRTPPARPTERGARRAVVAAGVLALAMAATACSSADEGPASATACNTPGFTPDEVKLGMIYPDSGVGSEAFAASRAGVDARVGLANAEGGVDGRDLTYDWRDDQLDPTQNNVAAHDLVERENVFGIVSTSIAMGGSADYLDTNGIPVAGLAADETWSQHRNMFAFSYTTGAAVDTYGLYAKAQGGTKMVLLQNSRSAASDAFSDKAVAGMQAAGIELVGRIETARESDSRQRTAQQIVDSGADVLVGATDPDVFAEVQHAARAAGAQLKVAMMFAGYDSRLLQALGPAMAGVSIPVFVEPFESAGPGMDRFRLAMARYAPQVQPAEQQFALYGYIAADLFVRGFQAAGDCPTRDSFIRALRGVSNYDAGGVVGPLDLSASFAQPTTCYAFVRVNDAGTAFDVVDKQLCGQVVPTGQPTGQSLG